jgi:hypothetical protein
MDEYEDFKQGKERKMEYDPAVYKKMGVQLMSEHDLKHLHLGKYLKNSKRLGDNELDSFANEVS